MKTAFIKYFIVTIFASALLLSSCKKETPDPTEEPDIQLEVKLEMMYNGEIIQLDQNLTTEQGYPFQVKELHIILTQIKNGDKNLLDASYMDLASRGNTLIKAVGNPNDFSNLQGAIGVVEPWNNADPVSFPNDSPLNIMNMGGMHWGWAAGYIFYKFEGLFSPSSGSETLNEVFTYHIGFNQYRENFSWENLDWTKINDYLYRTTVYLHVDDILDGPGGIIDLVAEPFTHATPDKTELNEKVVENFTHALRNN